MRFCCRTGSTPRHPNTLSLFRYEYNMIPPPRAGHGTFTTKHFLFRLQTREDSGMRIGIFIAARLFSTGISTIPLFAIHKAEKYDSGSDGY